MRRLEGKVALVTGAGGWGAIGRAVALRLARKGAVVAAADIERPAENIDDGGVPRLWEGTKTVVAEIEAVGGTALALGFDIRSEDEIGEAVHRVLKRFGHIDILVSNAGAAPGGDRVATVSLPKEEWDRVIAINLTGSFLVAKAVAKHMMERGRGGKIVFMDSVAGRQARPRRAAYSSSKFGLLGLNQVLARELGCHRINVNAICPGTVNTSRLVSTAKATCSELGLSWQEMHTHMLEEGAKRNVLGRLGTPEDIANLVAFLVSPESDFITGQAIVADGGAVMI